MASGLIAALGAGLLWGLVFLAPLVLGDYPGLMLAVGRYLAFGLLALGLAWFDRRALAKLSRADWMEAAKLALIGNLLYYASLASAIQLAGAALPTLIIGTLPVVIALCANVLNRRSGDEDVVRWSRLLLPLLLILTGLLIVHGNSGVGSDSAMHSEYALGLGLALCALACWTWYPLHNADWLREHSHRSPRTWATAQGVATLPLALLGYLLVWGFTATQPGDYPMPFGPRPGFFVALMLIMALLASWCGTLCWNEASQRLPTTLAGQLIIFETLAALAYAYLLRHSLPPPLTLLGVLLLITGVLQGVRLKPKPVAQC